MKRELKFSSGDRVELIGNELTDLFQRQIELTKREALVGLTPSEYEEYESITDRIRESYVELAKLGVNA